MQYNKLSALAQDTALRLEDIEYSPAVVLVAAGAEQSFFTSGGVSIGVFATGSYTLSVDGQQIASSGVSGVYSVPLAAGRHTALLTCSNGIAVICGGKAI